MHGPSQRAHGLLPKVSHTVLRPPALQVTAHISTTQMSSHCRLLCEIPQSAHHRSSRPSFFVRSCQCNSTVGSYLFRVSVANSSKTQSSCLSLLRVWVIGVMEALHSDTGRPPLPLQLLSSSGRGRACACCSDSPPLSRLPLPQNCLLWAFHRNRIACGLVSLAYATPPIFSGSIVQ